MVAHGILSAEIERPQVDGLVRCVVLSVESNADEALLEHVAAANLQFEDAFGKSLRQPKPSRRRPWP